MRNIIKIVSIIRYFLFFVIILNLLFTSPVIASSSTMDSSTISSTICTDDTSQNSNEDGNSIFRDVILPCSMEFLGAFLGVVFGVVITNIENRKKANILKINLENELLVMKDELNERVNSREKVDYYKYSTPVWDISIRSGVFNQLDSKNYEKYVGIYSYIEYAKEIESDWWLIKSCNGDINYLKKLQVQRMESSKEIISLISRTVKKENEND